MIFIPNFMKIYQLSQTLVDGERARARTHTHTHTHTHTYKTRTHKTHTHTKHTNTQNTHTQNTHRRARTYVFAGIIYINTQCVYRYKFAAKTERRSVFRVARVQHLLLSVTLYGLGKPTCHTHQWRKPVYFFELLLGKFNFERW